MHAECSQQGLASNLCWGKRPVQHRDSGGCSFGCGGKQGDEAMPKARSQEEQTAPVAQPTEEGAETTHAYGKGQAGRGGATPCTHACTHTCTHLQPVIDDHERVHRVVHHVVIHTDAIQVLLQDGSVRRQAKGGWSGARARAASCGRVHGCVCAGCVCRRVSARAALSGLCGRPR